MSANAEAKEAALNGCLVALASLVVRVLGVLLAWNLGVHGATNEPTINVLTALGIVFAIAAVAKAFVEA